MENYSTASRALSSMQLESTPLKFTATAVAIPRPPFLLWSPASETTTSIDFDDDAGRGGHNVVRGRESCFHYHHHHHPQRQLQQQQSYDSGISLEGVERRTGSRRSSAFAVPAKTLFKISPAALAFSIERLLHPHGVLQQEMEKARSPSHSQPIDLSIPTATDNNTEEAEEEAKFTPPPVSEQCASPPPQVHACSNCKKTYNSKSALRFHEATHTLPFGCVECGRRFSRGWLLESHRRTHTGEKPFACPACNRKFADPSNRRVHVTKVHPNLNHRKRSQRRHRGYNTLKHKPEKRNKKAVLH